MDQCGVDGATEKIRRVLRSWRGVSISDHPAGGTVFEVRGQEIGQVLGNMLVGIKFAAEVIAELEACQEVDSVHLDGSDSGRVTVNLNRPTDVSHAISLLERSYWDILMLEEIKGQLS